MVPKAPELLAARIREQILSGAIPIGHPLPNERDLSIETGLGRTTVREALRVLEIQGLIVTRTGRNGGSLVRRPPRASVEESIGTFIRGRQLRLEALLEVRASIEPAAARYAAIHRTPEDLANLHAIQARLVAAVDAGNLDQYLMSNVEWHLAVTQASHNELLIAFMTAIAQAVHAATEADAFNSDEIRAATMHVHDRILDAIAAGDPDAAERRMRKHVEAYVQLTSAQPKPRASKRKSRNKAAAR